jgi:hypothetical protein
MTRKEILNLSLESINQVIDRITLGLDLQECHDDGSRW